MAVLSLTIIASSEQIVAGIPKTVAITTNVPSSIFYTLDNSTPTLFSTIYTGPIFIPYSELTVTLKVFASNGTDTSPVVTETYETDVFSANVRLPHSGSLASPGQSLVNPYPFGDADLDPNAPFKPNNQVSITVDNPDLPQISNAFDSEGNPTAFTNEPYTLENYSIVYSTTDREGQTGKFIGTMPPQGPIEQPKPIPETSQQNNLTFDPRAFVIYQDVSKENPNDPPMINKMYFMAQNPETSRNGNAFFTTGLDAPPVNGSFLRSHFNPRTNTITYYYLDTWSNRWIISTMPYNPAAATPTPGALGNMVLAPGKGARHVYEWRPYQGRRLF